MQSISLAINDWILNTLMSMRASLPALEAKWTVADLELWSNYKRSISFLEAEAIKRGLSLPDIT